MLYDHDTNNVLDERRDHKKYVVKVISYKAPNNVHWIASAGWDGQISVYTVKLGPNSKIDALGEPVAYISLPTNPEALVFVEASEDTTPILVASRRDSTSLHYYSLHGTKATNPSSLSPKKLELLGTQNLTPHSNGWIAFSPSSMVLCPTDPSLLAVATSSVPHLKLIIVRLLLPPKVAQSTQVNTAPTQVAQAREDLARQDREDAAIQVSISTMAPQTPYSTPQVCWRPDGSGVWVNGDDGVIRGIEAKSGKIIALLKGGHEAGSKIRSIWAGMVSNKGKKEEWLVSGGFDRKLVVWRSVE